MTMAADAGTTPDNDKGNGKGMVLKDEEADDDMDMLPTPGC